MKKISCFEKFKRRARAWCVLHLHDKTEVYSVLLYIERALLAGLTLAVIILGFALYGRSVSTPPHYEEEAPETMWTDGAITAIMDYENDILTFSGEGSVGRLHSWVTGIKVAKVKTVVLEESVIAIGNCAFSGNFPNLSSIVIEGDLNAIGDCAFADCVNLKKVQFDGNCRAICISAFTNCVALDDINVPDGCLVDELAFSGCPAFDKAATDNVIQYPEAAPDMT